MCGVWEWKELGHSADGTEYRILGERDAIDGLYNVFLLLQHQLLESRRCHGDGV